MSGAGGDGKLYSNRRVALTRFYHKHHCSEP
jgi:hypothetical protein